MTSNIPAPQFFTVLQANKIIRHGRYFESVASTNQMALEQALELASGTVLIAGVQTLGRGRLQRTWHTERGDIAMSILLRPPHVGPELFLLPMLPAVAVVTALLRLGFQAKIKWPNDIVIKREGAPLSYCGTYRKVGGILVETVFQKNQLSAAVIGVGINIVSKASSSVNVPHAQGLQEVDPRIDYDTVLGAVLRVWDEMIVANRSAVHWLGVYKESCITLGKPVVVGSGDDAISGHAVDIGSDGCLVVFDGQQERRAYAGDVSQDQHASAPQNSD